MNTRAEGKHGEEFAAEFLRKQGYKILDKNYICHFGEIDLVAWDGTHVVFIEVKARRNTKFGLPREAVDWRKQQTIVQCARYWLYRKKKTGLPVRFDVIEILADNITHIVDAFRP